MCMYTSICIWYIYIDILFLVLRDLLSTDSVGGGLVGDRARTVSPMKAVLSRQCIVLPSLNQRLRGSGSDILRIVLGSAVRPPPCC